MRIDALLFNKGVFQSRNKAKESVLRGEIYYKNEKIEKPSFEISPVDFDRITVKRVATEFVSVGGFKLEKALNDFNFSVKNCVCADIGASTGGFTDCLISRGAKLVYAVDLNDALLSDKLKNDERVIPVIKNARNLILNDFEYTPEVLVADLSFISETLVLPVFSKILKDGRFALILIKPQFESGAKIKFKNGIVSDKNVILSSVKNVIVRALDCGFTPLNITPAPIVDGKNREFIILLEKRKILTFNVETFIEKCDFSVIK